MFEQIDLGDVTEVSQKEIPDFWGGCLFPFAYIKPNPNKRMEKLTQVYMYYVQMLSEGSS